MSKPNTSFKTQSPQEFNPVERWKKDLAAHELAKIEELIGETLTELGYRLASPETHHSGLGLVGQKFVYHSFFEVKLWAKNSAVIRAIRPALSSEEIDEIVIVDENGPEKIRQLNVEAR